jgi:hypothetical protein
MINPTRKDKIVKGTAATFKPSEDASAGRIKQLELNGSAGLPLHHERARPDLATRDEITDLDLHYVAAPQLAIDRKIEHGAVAYPALTIEPESDRPDLLRLQRALAAYLPAGIPRAPISGAWIKLGLSHDYSPLWPIGQEENGA